MFAKSPFVVAAAAASLAASSAHAGFMDMSTGNDVALECSVNAPSSSHFICIGFILGVASGVRDARAACIPHEARPSDLLIVVQASLDETSTLALGSIDGATAVRRALAYQWPCGH
jgi:hypothetical protein